jgi:hypothetical protein
MAGTVRQAAARDRQADRETDRKKREKRGRDLHRHPRPGDDDSDVADKNAPAQRVDKPLKDLLFCAPTVSVGKGSLSLSLSLCPYLRSIAVYALHDCVGERDDVICVRVWWRRQRALLLHTQAYVSIRQHTVASAARSSPAYVSIRQHTVASAARSFPAASASVFVLLY